MDVEKDRRRSAATPHTTQGSQNRWPARAQKLLDSSYLQCLETLHEPLRRCLRGFEEQLFALAERTHRTAEQQDYFFSRQRVLQDRVLFEQRFNSGLNAAFNTMGREPDTAPSGSSDKPWRTLELLDPAEQELSMAVTQLGGRGEARHSQILHELGYRLAVLVAAPPLEGDALPLGPHSLARIFHLAGGELKLPLQHHLLMLQSFDKHIIPSLASVYDAVNAQLIGDGILRQLRHAPVPRQVQQHSRHDTVAVEKSSGPPGQKAAAPAPDAGATNREGGSIEVLESLRNLLAQQRGGDTAPGRPSAGRTASKEELQTALGALQQHLAQVTDKASRELRSAQRLREELLAQLNAGKPADSPSTQLSGEQGDTVELVAMLFEQLGQQMRQGGSARALLGDLQLPVLRMAVTDSDFFEQHEHPARKLLDTVAAAANDWLDEGDDQSNRPLAEKLQQLVKRANQEPPSAGLYTTLLADIEHHLGLLSRKAKAAERRHVEAAKGRERLNQARRQAGELMAERFTQSSPRGLLRTLLDRAWSDVLALTLLRHGQDSTAFKGQLMITDQLLGRLPIDDRQQLQQEVEAGLQQIGMPVEDAEQMTRRLLASIAVDIAKPMPSPPATEPSVTVDTSETETTQNSEKTLAAASSSTNWPASDRLPSSPPAIAIAANNRTSTTHLAQRLKQHHRLGERSETPTRTPATTQPAAPLPMLGPQEARIHNHLRKLPFGTWFEFLDTKTGQHTQRKLAWFSPVSGNTLFVTRRGLRCDAMTLHQLTLAIASGTVRELPPQKDSLLDRAWHSLTHSLGQATSTEHAPRESIR